MKKSLIIVALLLVAAFAVGVAADQLVMSNTPAAVTLFDVSTEPTGGALMSNGAGLDVFNTFVQFTSTGEKLAEMKNVSAAVDTTDRIKFSCLNDNPAYAGNEQFSIINYQYLRVRFKTESAMQIHVKLGSDYFTVKNLTFVDKNGTVVAASNGGTPANANAVHDIPANFDGYIYVDLTSFYEQGGPECTRVLGSADKFGVSQCDPEYINTLTMLFGGTADALFYVGDMDLCNAELTSVTLFDVSTEPTGGAFMSNGAGLEVFNTFVQFTSTGEKLAEMKNVSAAVDTTDRIRFTCLNDNPAYAGNEKFSIINYQFLRVRFKTESAMQIHVNLGSDYFVVKNLTFVDKNGDFVAASNGGTPANANAVHDIPANFDGYIYVDLTSFYEQGGPECTRVLGSADRFGVSQCDPEYINTLTMLFGGTADALFYVGDMDLCNAELPEPPQPSPSPSVEPSVEPSIEPSVAPSVEPSVEPSTTATAGPGQSGPMGAPLMIGVALAALVSAGFVLKKNK